MENKRNSTEYPELDAALLKYIETFDFNLLKPFIGKVYGYEPYGEAELGKAIDIGDEILVKSLVTKLTNADTKNFAEDESGTNETTPTAPSNDNKPLVDQELDKCNENLDSEEQKEIRQLELDAAKKNMLSPAAQQVLKDNVKSKFNLAKKFDNKFFGDYKKSLEDHKKAKATQIVNSSYVNNEDKNMKLSKNDIKRLAVAMKTLTKHFAESEDDYEPGEIQDAINEANEEEAGVPNDNDQLYMPESLVEDIKNIINTKVDEMKTDLDQVVEDTSSDDVDNDDSAEPVQVNECGGYSSFSETQFYEFAQAITETIQNLQFSIGEIAETAKDLAKDAKDGDLADESIKSYEKFIKGFSAKDFMQFAEGATQTLENIENYVKDLKSQADNLEDRVEPITKDLTAISDTADDFEDEFVTKAEEGAEQNVETVVDQPQISVETQAKTEEQTAFSSRYNKVKNFLTFTDKL